MAKHQLVTYSYTCDVCGGTIPESGANGASRMLKWEGTDYALDVCESHGSQLGDLLSQLQGFVDAGRRDTPARGRRRRPAAGSAPGATGPARGAGPARSTRRATTAPAAAAAAPAPVIAPSTEAPARVDVAAIRSWARDNGYVVNERGRIPGPVMAAYEAVRGGAGRSVVTTSVPAARSGRGRKTAKA